jgi:hypothetical protein
MLPFCSDAIAKIKEQQLPEQRVKCNDESNLFLSSSNVAADNSGFFKSFFVGNAIAHRN